MFCDFACHSVNPILIVLLLTHVSQELLSVCHTNTTIFAVQMKEC